MGRDKLLIEIGGRPVLSVTLGVLRDAGIPRILVGVRPGRASALRDVALAPFGLDAPLIECVDGGETRQETVWNCLCRAEPSDFVLVHDAARPFCSTRLVQEVARAAMTYGAAAACVPVVDTLHTVQDAFLDGTPKREAFWRAQTPQAFARVLLERAHRQAREGGTVATDDAALVRSLGAPVRLVPGEESNRKLTVAADLPPETPPISVGWGTDIHRLVEGRPLILGGVHIPFPFGLLGHSDADVLCHAFADAVLGGSGQGDIGRHFPPSDAQYAGADSLDLLARSVALARAAGWRPQRGDSTIIAERPHLAEYVEQMRCNMARALGVPPEAVNVKAGTNEGLGHLGRGEAIAAQAVVVLGPA